MTIHGVRISTSVLIHGLSTYDPSVRADGQGFACERSAVFVTLRVLGTDAWLNIFIADLPPGLQIERISPVQGDAHAVIAACRPNL